MPPKSEPDMHEASLCAKSGLFLGPAPDGNVEATVLLLLPKGGQRTKTTVEGTKKRHATP